MASMLRRQAPAYFRLLCVTDQPQSLPPAVEAIDASAWGLPGWFNKLRLFDAATTGNEPFLYLDLSLVVMRSLGPLLDFAESEPAPLIAVRDWHYDSLNSCAMWIRPGPTNQKVWDDYAAGVRYETRLKSDQDFINATVRPTPAAFATFPEGMIASYKALRKINRKSPAEARAAFEQATILKFHGEPKPLQLLDRWTAIRLALRDGLRHPKNLCPDWRFLEKDVRENWR